MKKVTATCLLAAAIAGSGTAQAPTWKAELLFTPPASWSTAAAQAVNDAGIVAGITYLDGWKHGWVAGPNQPVELLPLPAWANWSEVTDINASGVVCGRVVNNSSPHAAIWTPGPTGYQLVLLPIIDGLPPIDARGINDAGEVVGKLGPFSNYVWSQAGGLTELSTSDFPVTPENINNQRQVVGDTYRMDLDTLVLEDLGNPTGTGYNYMFSDLTVINDSGWCGGYGNTASSGWNKQAVRYANSGGWKAFNTPVITANVMGIANSGDTVYQLGTFGLHVWVEGYGNVPLQSTLDPAYAHFSLSGAFAPYISPGSLLATNGLNTQTGESGIVLLTPLFDAPTIYCAAKASSAGCFAAISTSNALSQPTSGAGDYAVTAAHVQELKNGLLFAGIAGPANLPFSGGTLCVQPPTKRGPVVASGGSDLNGCSGSFSTLVNDGNLIPFGLDAGAGNSCWYQYWYRDPANGVGQLGTALSNALQLDFQ